MAGALREIADAPDPLYETQDQSTRRTDCAWSACAALGVIGVVYEIART